MSCDNSTALQALRRGHVSWDTLHPRVKLRLNVAGYTPEHPSFRGTPAAAEDHDHVFDEDHR